jgi:arginase
MVHLFIENRGILMNIELIQVPYDSGHYCQRTGCGPDYFIHNGLAAILQKDGHQVNVHRIESKSAFLMEIGTAFELNRLLAEHIHSCPDNPFPLILSGNCNSCVGALAGLGLDPVGIIWFDAHGDYNTPETTLSGFLDGMGLAMATGRCWQSLLQQQIPGYKPVPEGSVIHVGALDLDLAEKNGFEKAGIPVVTNIASDKSAFISHFKQSLNNLANRVQAVYIHIDMDVLETGEAKANHLAVSGGLNAETVTNCLEMIKEKFAIAGCGIASLDPAFDKAQIVLNDGMRLIKTLFK